MTMRTLAKLVSISVLAALVGLWTLGEAGDLERRVPVGPGGSLDVAIALGGGFSFDHGSLQIRSHGEDDVRVLAETTGWGGYAVDLDLSHDGAAQRVVLDAKVEGALHWMFGGPALDVEIWVPRRFTVNASIEGGPLVLEDLVGPITVRVGATDVTVRRAEGLVQLVSERGSVEVEDVRGNLAIESGHGNVEVVGVRGSLRVETAHGRVDVESVTGPVYVRTERGRVDIDHVLGDVDVETERGHVEIEDVEGRVSAVAVSADIQIEEVKGAVVARSTRGSIDVEFSGAPMGEIETERGDIVVEVPRGVGFELAAHTGRGRIDIGDGDNGVKRFSRRNFVRWREEWRARRTELRRQGDRLWSERTEELGDAAGPEQSLVLREQSVVRSLNGGGQPLSLRTGRGSIRVEQQ